MSLKKRISCCLDPSLPRINLECELMRRQRVVTVQGEDMSQASKVNEDMQASWTQL